jgi:hypothetical protein
MVYSAFRTQIEYTMISVANNLLATPNIQHLGSNLMNIQCAYDLKPFAFENILVSENGNILIEEVSKISQSRCRELPKAMGKFGNRLDCSIPQCCQIS